MQTGGVDNTAWLWHPGCDYDDDVMITLPVTQVVVRKDGMIGRVVI